MSGRQAFNQIGIIDTLLEKEHQTLTIYFGLDKLLKFNYHFEIGFDSIGFTSERNEEMKMIHPHNFLLLLLWKTAHTEYGEFSNKKKIRTNYLLMENFLIYSDI